MNNTLTIYIPTYNRKFQLINLLKGIERIDCDFLEEVIVSDNCSNYDVEDCLKNSISLSLSLKLKIIRNPINIGAPGNIRNAYYWCKTKWLWLIGDDDEVLDDSIQTIYNDIKCDPNCAQFRYSTSKKNSESILQEDDARIESLHDLISYYKHNKQHTRGNFMFMSNNVFNMDKLTPYFMYAFIYSTSLTQLIPLFMGLDERKIYARYRKASIIRYIHPENGTEWNHMRIILAISTISHIPLKSIDKKLKSELLNMAKCVDLLHIIKYLSDKKYTFDYHMISSVYHGLYKYVEPWYIKILYYVMLFQLKTSIPLCSLIVKSIFNLNDFLKGKRRVTINYSDSL